MSNKQGKYAEQAHKIVPDMMGVLTGILSMGFGFLLIHLITSQSVQLADGIQLVIMVFFAATALITWNGYRKNQEFNQSEAYLGKAIEMVNRAREVLESPRPQVMSGREEILSRARHISGSEVSVPAKVSNDRICWVTAARLISRAEQIATLITARAHKHIFEAEHDYQRHVFHDLLMHRGQPLPSAFFFGGEYEKTSLGQAAHDSLHEVGSEAWIPPRIVSVIYRFFQYPDGYTDPLNSSEALTDKERKNLSLSDQRGVHDYLVFREQFVGTDHYIVRKDVDPVKPREPTASEIDKELNQMPTASLFK